MNKTNLLYRIGAAAFAGIIVTVLLYAFAFPQPCDIDSVYLWCRTHPVGVFDVVGGITMGLGAAWTLIYWWNADGSLEDRTWLEFVGVALALVGIILMWIK